jgi:hypothetical protein
MAVVQAVQMSTHSCRVLLINTAMFDWSGLGTRKHLILLQNPDPLEYCTYSLPFPTSLGIPCTPCDLPNEYTLHESNEDYSEVGDKVLQFEEEIDSLSRIVLTPSHRPWKIIGKVIQPKIQDYYNHTPMIGFRDFNVCLTSERPQVRAYYQSKYVGRVEETTILNCCCMSTHFNHEDQKYQEFKLYRADNTVAFRVTAMSGQPGQLIILPFWGFDKIRYTIRRVASSPDCGGGSDSDEEMPIPESHCGGG